ncbi:MAG: hypothetical protein JRF06_02475 [Deltaproteobacteria bacterium]|nr:hypothetical protein [Deltaproteobacteria bacterium]
MSIEIERSVLKKACMEMIETILFSLPNAFKGTIYQIGKPPDLIAERITSGIIDDGKGKISWGLPAKSGYNSPGKPWLEFRDQPGRPLEAMSWCVEKQKSWTSEDPEKDARNLRFQVEGITKDFHHMEPVLVLKSDLTLDMHSSLNYPNDYKGNTIWKDSDYIVVAVIKIHFHPFTIKIGSHETKIIKKLSRSLGTELLSYQLRQDSMKTMEQLATDRLNACNILADSLRNAITKSGLIFSLVKQEIGYLRDQWEQALIEDRKENNMKVEAIRDLNEILTSLGDGYEDLKEDLVDAQNKFLELSLPPEKGENWVGMQIEERWKDLLYECPQDDHKRRIVWETIDKLKKSLHFGQDPDIIANYNKIPEELKKEWVNLMYRNNDKFDDSALDRLIKVLANSALTIPSREKSKKTLTQLKALAQTMNQLEQNTNFLLDRILNGSEKSLISGALKNITVNS